ncbi:transcription factor bHLH131 [Lotus japonicus]|uniref:transcription factor bHLH131 n=1 Tax=Lotus japonicus TaxID=34305 RepID=UPI002588F9CF|nr:transcription factor bHLH131 [Lotus japonicus]
MVSFQQGMQHFRNYYNSEASMIGSSFPRTFLSQTYKNSFSKPRSTEEIKLLAAKKHSEAEKRRRTRINGQYDTLRNTLPNIIKKDKATVLSETIKQVKELRKKVSKLEVDGPKEVKFPSGADRLNLEKCNEDKGMIVKATLSCEDRPELMSAIARALRSMKANVIKAEMLTVGGRTRTVLWVQGIGTEGLGKLKSTLKVVMHKPSFKMRRFTQ